MKDITDPKSVAESLTEAQRKFLLGLPADGAWGYSASFVRQIQAEFGPNAMRGFGKSGLIDGFYHDPLRHRLTPLGLAVRNILTGEQ